jgi:hypothetical protein
MKSTYASLFAVLMASTAWAGSHGNGAAQRNGTSPQPATSYAFCYGGNPHVAYFSRVFQVDPAVNNGGGAFGNYLGQKGYVNDGGQCRSSTSEAGADAYKKESEDMFRSATYHNRTIVEIDWPGTQ